jgi:hypothetical protein
MNTITSEAAPAAAPRPKWQMALPGFLYFILSLTVVIGGRGRRWAHHRLRADDVGGKSA